MKDILKKVRKMEISTRKLVDGLILGQYHSIFKGRGIEFSEVREYQYGDDVRAIDWNVTARMGKPFVKEFIEERDLTVYIVFDISSSGEFGSEKQKRETATELAASLMFAAMKNNDNVGLFLSTDRIEKYISARKGKRHVLKLISELLSSEPENNATDLNASLRQVSKIVKKRSIIFIISDFLTGDFSQPLKILRNKHDIICVNINDLREKDMPDVGYIELEDAETGEQILVDTSDEDFRKEYARLVKQNSINLKRTLSKMKIDLIELVSDEPFELPLRRFFHLRSRRMIR